VATEKQNAANKRNAQNSTGPTTEAGRSRSSRNALKHGLTAEKVTIDGEDPKQFEAFRDDVLESLRPEGAIEEQLAERIVLCWWRLRRVCRMEADIARRSIEQRMSSTRTAYSLGTRMELASSRQN
jgi:hypothetical protein